MTKTVLITGCSSGFGLAAVGLFADEGWNVVATVRRLEDGAPFAGRDNVLVARLDVQDPATIEAAIQAGIDRFGGIDALINNAGFGLFGVFEGTSPEKVREQFDVNVFGLMETTRAILPHFRANRSGVVVNITSGAGVFGLPMSSLYNASKFAVEGFSEALSYELEPLGVRVKLVEPGGVLATKFGQRVGAEAAQTTAPEDYAPIIAAGETLFEGLRAVRRGATPADVARVMLEACMDRTDRLRWVATDDIKPLVALRREAGEDVYWAEMRKAFALKG
ncbi:SDR family oxidoreductase [Brevundimonas sp. NIBR11]|uniref:SDR family oxidoreductase n=1 Tax=Brevundimonas sp. NIBR11 TaxID=3015999 RepID=UPI0022F0B9E9|nr:SDR family oxidoreductase [Brevundimonas sp. NIBR11]WGM30248.1 3-phenylpropionate-dihydrodiol/cinnamic acid-dihydrodiol dehydrogenase [Brevundimonas sp. NIBR11]